MSIKEALGFGSEKKIRYAIVGVGDIAQGAMMPGVAHTGNSEITAFVTGDPEKARELAKEYKVETTCSYEHYEGLLTSEKIDAIYLATPNWRHAEFAVPALRAGIHVLVEKPLEINTEKCREILEAQKEKGAKLLVAYRLHFEPGTLRILDLVRSGELGEILFFSSTFSQVVKADNHRAKSGKAAGPIYDMGPYPINAVRNIFGSEPLEVTAFGARLPDSGLGDFEHTSTVSLRFPGNRLAQFTVSYVGNSLDTYTVVGTKGSITASPAFSYHEGIAFELMLGEKEKKESFSHTDQFGGEMRYFSDCILNGKDPEPDGEEGELDVRVIEAVVRAMQTGEKQILEPRQRGKAIDLEQVQKLSAVKPPEKVHAESPSK